MADIFRAQVQNVELKDEFHPPGMFWRQVINHPPAYASGALNRSVLPTYAVAGTDASASVGAYAKYAAIQEEGGDTWSNRPGDFMHWINTGGEWYMRRVTVPPHPYFRPALEKVIRDGSLRRSALSAFSARVMPYFQ